MLLIAAALLAGGEAPAPLHVQIADHRGRCQVAFEGERIPWGDLYRRARALAGRGREAHIAPAHSTFAAHCIGAVIATLQRAGFTKVGFISAPKASK